MRLEASAYPSSTAHLTNEERRRRLREKAYFIDLQMLSFAQDAAEFAATDAWEEDGSASPIDWLRFNCHLTSTVAADRIAVGEAMNRLPESVQATLNGEIGFAHLKDMARTADAVGSKFDETKLLEKAREHSPGKFHFICHHYRHAADRQGFEAEPVELMPARKALNVRDRHCTWPGCERPASSCAGHHLKHWVHGGTNESDNLTLLCSRHRWMVHEGNWQIVRGDDGRTLTIPPTVAFGPSPRGPD